MKNEPSKTNPEEQIPPVPNQAPSPKDLEAIEKAKQREAQLQAKLAKLRQHDPHVYPTF